MEVLSVSEANWGYYVRVFGYAEMKSEGRCGNFVVGKVW